MSDPFEVGRRDALGIAIGAVGLGVAGFSLAELMLPYETMATQIDTGSSVSAELRAILAGQQWVNSPPLRAEDVRGKVVLVNFWTYSCINSLRMLPYTKAWHDRYGARGLVLIGVHTPEFAFEKDFAKVSTASESYRVKYPVVLDSDYSIWRAFRNQGWPGLYFIDVAGKVRRRVLGEGNYDKSENLIQKLLSEANNEPVPRDIATVAGTGPEAAPDEANLRSPETYVGYARATNFASPSGIKRDISNSYRAAPKLALNYWGLVGDWTAGNEFALLNKATGSVQYRFHARDLHLVLGRAPQSSPVKFRLKIDGAPPGADHGVDADADGNGVVSEDRMYQLVRQKGAVKDRTFEIEFFDPGVRIYDFTFG